MLVVYIVHCQNRSLRQASQAEGFVLLIFLEISVSNGQQHLPRVDLPFSYSAGIDIFLKSGPYHDEIKEL